MPINDVGNDIDIGTVMNLIQSIYAMREHRESLDAASSDKTVLKWCLGCRKFIYQGRVNHYELVKDYIKRSYYLYCL